MLPSSNFSLVDARLGERMRKEHVVRRPRLEGRFAQAVVRGAGTLTVEAGLPFLVSLRERRRVAVKFSRVRRREAGREARGIDDGLLVTRVLVDARYARYSDALVRAFRTGSVLGDAGLLRRVEEVPELRVEVALLARAAAHGGRSRLCGLGGGWAL